MRRSHSNRFDQNASHALALKIFDRLPPSHRQSYRRAQIQALRAARPQGASARPSNRLAYSQTKLSSSSRTMLTPILCMMVSMAGAGCMAGLMNLRYSYQRATANPVANSYHPTVLPFRKDAHNCEKNGGVWSHSECVDYEHSPMF